MLLEIQSLMANYHISLEKIGFKVHFATTKPKEHLELKLTNQQMVKFAERFATLHTLLSCQFCNE